MSLGLTMCSRRLLVPRCFLFSAFGCTARSNSGTAVAVSFRLKIFILSTLRDALQKANKTSDGVEPRQCEHRLGIPIV